MGLRTTEVKSLKCWNLLSPSLEGLLKEAGSEKRKCLKNLRQCMALADLNWAPKQVPWLLRASGSTSVVERPPEEQSRHLLPSAPSALPRHPTGSTSLSPALLGSDASSAGLVQLSRPQYSRPFKQQGQGVVTWPELGNWPASPERGRRQPEVTMQVKANFGVLSIASGKKQDCLARKWGVGVRKKVNLTTVVGVTMKPEGHWDLPGTQAEKAPHPWLSPTEVLVLTCCFCSSFNGYE